MNDFAKHLEEIVLDKERGAAQLAGVAIRALMEFCRSLKADNAQSFLTETKKAVAQVSRCRPSMAPIANWSIEFYGLLAERLREAASIEDCYAYAAEVGQHLLQAQVACLRKQIDLARPFLQKFSTILTLSYSSTVEKLLLEAVPSSARIIVLESRPLCEGRKLALALHRQNRPVQLITEAQAALFIPQTDVVLVGADTICSGLRPDPLGSASLTDAPLSSDLAVVNKVGTKMICLLAKASNLPCVVAADTYKILPDVASEEVLLEEKDGAEVWPEYPFLCKNVYFEPMPVSLIAHFITERGILTPAGMKEEWNRLRTLRRNLAV